MRWAAVVATTVMLAWAPTSGAAVMRATFTGTASIQDCGGFFSGATNGVAACLDGSFGTWYENVPFMLSFDFRTDLGVYLTPVNVRGGVLLGSSSPIFASKFIAAGTTLTLPEIGFSEIGYYPNAGMVFAAHGYENGAIAPLVSGDVMWDWGLGFSGDSGALLPTSLDRPYASTGLGGGLLTFREIYDYAGGYNEGYANLSVSEVRVAAIPEPEAWALFIIGFGTLGMVLRRSRASTLMRISRAVAPVGRGRQTSTA